MMSKVSILRSLVAFSLILFSVPVLSANFAFMYDTAGQYFNAQDWKMLEANTDKALNTLANGKSMKWINPKTGNGGSLMPLNSMNKQGTTCRDLQITNHAHYRTDQYVFMFCKYGRDWRIPNKRV
jgi:hypothetical protein